MKHRCYKDYNSLKDYRMDDFMKQLTNLQPKFNKYVEYVIEELTNREYGDVYRFCNYLKSTIIDIESILNKIQDEV